MRCSVEIVASTQIWIGLMAIAIGFFWVGERIVEQMKRRNDLIEAELRSAGVFPKNAVTPDRPEGMDNPEEKR